MVKAKIKKSLSGVKQAIDEFFENGTITDTLINEIKPFKFLHEQIKEEKEPFEKYF